MVNLNKSCFAYTTKKTEKTLLGNEPFQLFLFIAHDFFSLRKWLYRKLDRRGTEGKMRREK